MCNQRDWCDPGDMVIIHERRRPDGRVDVTQQCARCRIEQTGVLCGDEQYDEYGSTGLSCGLPAGHRGECGFSL